MPPGRWRSLVGVSLEADLLFPIWKTMARFHMRSRGHRRPVAVAHCRRRGCPSHESGAQFLSPGESRTIWKAVSNSEVPLNDRKARRQGSVTHGGGRSKNHAVGPMVAEYKGG